MPLSIARSRYGFPPGARSTYFTWVPRSDAELLDHTTAAQPVPSRSASSTAAAPPNAGKPSIATESP